MLCLVGVYSSRFVQECRLRVTAMGNLSQVRRVVCEHDWQSLAEWPRALDKLADLTDDEIDCLVRSDQQIESV